MKLEIKIDFPDVGRQVGVAAGSVMDHLSTRVARWMESALAKTDANELTQEEMLALAIGAGCQVRTVITGESTYRLEAVHPISVAYVDGQWRVYEQLNIEADDKPENLNG